MEGALPECPGTGPRKGALLVCPGTGPRKGLSVPDAQGRLFCPASPQVCSVDVHLVPAPQIERLLDFQIFNALIEKCSLIWKVYSYFVINEEDRPFSYLSHTHFVNMRFFLIHFKVGCFFFSYFRDSLYILYFFLSRKLEMFFPHCVTCLWTLLIACFFPPNESLFLCRQIYLHFLNCLMMTSIVFKVWVSVKMFITECRF